MERKCNSCGHWNQTQENCEKCGALISPEKIRNEEAQSEMQKWVERERSRMEIVLEKMKKSRYSFVRTAYVFLRIFWMVYMAIITFFLWFIALGPG